MTEYSPLLFVLFTIMLFGYAGGAIVALSRKMHIAFIGLMMLVGLYVVIVIFLAKEVFV